MVVTQYNVSVISKDFNDNAPPPSQDNNNDEPYDPYKHRQGTHKLSDWRALFTLLKSALGSGILAMPLAFSCAGTAVGVIGTILVGYVCTYCGQILVEQSLLICRAIKRPSLTYGETVQEAFRLGPKALRPYANGMKVFADLAMGFTYLGAACVYIAIMGNSIKQLVEHELSYHFTFSTYALALMVPLVLMVQIRHLRQLAPFSALATMFLVSVCGISFYFVLKDGISFEKTVPSTDIERLPLFISTVIFAMEGVGVIMLIENKMSKPQHFLGCPGVLNVAMFIVVLLYMSLGFFGYTKYGNDAKGTITLNLDQNAPAALVAKVLVVLAIFFTYPLQYFVFSDVVWSYLKNMTGKNYYEVKKTIFLTSGVVFTILCAVLLPKIDALIELVGSIFFSTLGLFFPALIETMFMWDRGLGKFYWRLWKNMLIMLFSLTALACGVQDAIRNIGA